MYLMQEPKSLVEGLTILRDQVVVSQGDAIIKEKQEFDEKTEQQKLKLTKDVMSQIQKRMDNKYIAFKLSKNVDIHIKHALLKEVYRTFSCNAKLYSLKKRNRNIYDGTYIYNENNVWSNINDLNIWVLIDNRRPESLTRPIAILATDLKKSLK